MLHVRFINWLLPRVPQPPFAHDRHRPAAVVVFDIAYLTNGHYTHSVLCNLAAKERFR